MSSRSTWQTSCRSATMDGDNKQLRLLSLDGGGVRGLSSLMILKKLMESVADDPDNPPKVSVGY